MSQKKCTFEHLPAAHSHCSIQLKIIRQTYAHDPNQLNFKWGTTCTPLEILVSDDLRPIEDEKSES